MKTYTLTFPDGCVIAGFRWSILGWYYRDFPITGIPSQQAQSLQFTRRACENASIAIQPEA